MDAPDAGAAESRRFFLLLLAHPAMVGKIAAELLHIHGGELAELDFADVRNDMIPNHVLIVERGGFPDVGLGVQFKPGVDPLRHRVFLCADDVDAVAFRNGLRQFFLDLGLRSAEDVFEYLLTGGGIVPYRVPAFPASVLSLSDAALAVCAFS